MANLPQTPPQNFPNTTLTAIIITSGGKDSATMLHLLILLQRKVCCEKNIVLAPCSQCSS